MKNKIIKIFFILIFILTIINSVSAIDIDMDFGFNGFYKDNSAVPVKLKILNNENKIISGDIYITPSYAATIKRKIIVPPNSVHKLELKIFANQNLHNVRIKIQDSSGNYIYNKEHNTGRFKRMKFNSLNVLMLDKYSVGLKKLEKIQKGKKGKKGKKWSRGNVIAGNLELIPEMSGSLQQLDGILLGDINPDKLSLKQHKELNEYVKNGGNLIFFVNNDYKLIKSEFFKEFFPYSEYEEAVKNIKITEFLNKNIDSFMMENKRTIELKGLGEGFKNNRFLKSNEIICNYKNYGSGKVYFFTINLLDRNIQNDDDILNYLYQILKNNFKPLIKIGTSIEEDSLKPQSLEPFEPTALFFFSFIFIIIVGPVNYIILYFKKKRQLLAITIPVISIIFSLLIFAVINFSRNDGSFIRHVEIIQIPFYHTDMNDKEISVFTDGIYNIYSSVARDLKIFSENEFNYMPFYYWNYKSRNYSEMMENAYSKYENLKGELSPLFVHRSSNNIFCYTGQKQIKLPAEISNLELEYNDSKIKKINVKINNKLNKNIDRVFLIYGKNNYVIGTDLSPGENVLKKIGKGKSPGNWDYFQKRVSNSVVSSLNYNSYNRFELKENEIRIVMCVDNPPLSIKSNISYSDEKKYGIYVYSIEEDNLNIVYTENKKRTKRKK